MGVVGGKAERLYMCEEPKKEEKEKEKEKEKGSQGISIALLGFQIIKYLY